MYKNRGESVFVMLNLKMWAAALFSHRTIRGRPSQSCFCTPSLFFFLVFSSLPRLHLEAEAGHAGAVLVDGGFAVGGRVGGVGEEHALVALGLFLCANAAGLECVSSVWILDRQADSKTGNCSRERTLGLEAASLVAMLGAGHDSAAVREATKLAWVAIHGCRHDVGAGWGVFSYELMMPVVRTAFCAVVWWF